MLISHSLPVSTWPALPGSWFSRLNGVVDRGDDLVERASEMAGLPR
jgi:hypothetical protein